MRSDARGRDRWWSAAVTAATVRYGDDVVRRRYGGSTRVGVCDLVRHGGGACSGACDRGWRSRGEVFVCVRIRRHETAVYVLVEQY